jgi:DNA-binding MarR family transcriptional regulator
MIALTRLSNSATSPLERDGLLQSKPNPDHKTSSLVVLTDAGRNLLFAA